MDHQSEIREFLSTRRARITPEQAGLPAFGGNRRVKGLRREEVALLAGVSIDYYVRMERGNLGGVSESVLNAVARALQLDEAEHTHLFELARRSPTPAPRQRKPAPKQVKPSIQQILDAITEAPAWVRNARHDLLATNSMARALYAPMISSAEQPPNTARFLYLDPTSKDFFPEWERSAEDVAAMLRSEAGRNPHDKALSELIGELSTRSEVFRQRWAAHNVRFHRTGFKRVNHPVVGYLEMHFEAMEFPSEPGLTLLVYTAAAGTPTADALKLLGSWAKTQELNREPAPDPSLEKRQ
ncbi:helix-turn-helix transcriptional regulator [Arthrobacter cupressi]